MGEHAIVVGGSVLYPMPTEHSHQSAPMRLHVGHCRLTDRTYESEALRGQGQDQDESFGGALRFLAPEWPFSVGCGSGREAR